MIKLIVVGKIKEKALESLIQDYIKRIQSFSKILIEEIKDEPNYEDEAKNLQSLMKESQSILSKITKDEHVILLELRGKLIDSIELSEQMDKAMIYGSKNIVFVIGGSLGVHEEVRQRANILWKLSANTFPHGIVRLLVVEQIYRAFKILNNQTYHK